MNLLNKFAVASLLSGCAFAANATFFFNASTDYNSESDIKGTNEDVSISTYTISAGYNNHFLAYTRSDYDFSTKWPFDSLNYLYYDYHDDFALSSSFAIFAGLGLGAGWESDFNLDDNYAISPRVGIGYNITDNVTLFAGATAQFNDVDNKYLPILGLEIGKDRYLGWSGAIAYPATKITYRFNDFWALQGTFLVTQKLYQLDADDYHVFEEGYGASAGVILTPIKQLNINVGAQGYFDREYTFYKNGNEIGSYEVDPSVGLFAKANFVF